MKHVVSNDGTPIAFERTGTGPPLVLVHGTGVDHTYWELLIPELARDFTVYAVDRRGRGQSGDTPPYALALEFGDVAALVDSIPGPVGVLGHSYGALCALEAALLTPHIHRLALNEPPVHTTVESGYSPEVLDEFDSLLKAGRAEEALLMAYRVSETPTDELEAMRSLPSWRARVLAAHTIPREVISVRNFAFDPSRFRNLKTPILFLLGSESPPVYKAATHMLHGSLPHSRIAILPGQGHDPAVTAPELLLREVIGFFREDS